MGGGDPGGVQTPIFVSFFMALQQMAAAPLPGLKGGGAAWISDLSCPDPTYALPLLTSATMWMVLEVRPGRTRGGGGGSAAPPCGWRWNCSRIMRLYGDIGSVAPPCGWSWRYGLGGLGGWKGLSSATVRMGVELQSYNGALWGYGLSSATVWMVLEVRPGRTRGVEGALQRHRVDGGGTAVV